LAISAKTTRRGKGEKRRKARTFHVNDQLEKRLYRRREGEAFKERGILTPNMFAGSLKEGGMQEQPKGGMKRAWECQKDARTIRGKGGTLRRKSLPWEKRALSIQ